MPLFDCKIDLILTWSENGFITDPAFKGVNRLFVLSVDANADRRGHIEYFLSKRKIKYYNVTINLKLFLIIMLKVVKEYKNIW